MVFLRKCIVGGLLSGGINALSSTAEILGTGISSGSSGLDVATAGGPLEDKVRIRAFRAALGALDPGPLTLVDDLTPTAKPTAPIELVIALPMDAVTAIVGFIGIGGLIIAVGASLLALLYRLADPLLDPFWSLIPSSRA